MIKLLLSTLLLVGLCSCSSDSEAQLRQENSQLRSQNRDLRNMLQNLRRENNRKQINNQLSK